MDNQDNQEKSKVVIGLNFFTRLLNRFRELRKRVNQRMESRYSPSIIALVVTCISVILLIIMLFLPNYLGVADDGSISKVMNGVGVSYLESDVDEIYNNYFVRVYSNVLTEYQMASSNLSSHIIIVKTAVWLDNLFTHDKYFDIRFLGLIYGLLYAPALWLFVRQACVRVKRFSEGMVIGIFGVLIFADVSYITYFNSFYPEALWFIAFLYCVGAGLASQEKRSGGKDFALLMLVMASGLILVSSRQQCAVIGIILSAYILKLMFIRKHWLWVATCVITATFLSFFSLLCMIRLENDFDVRSKFHAMTRGVLFQSDNPTETLEEFGIDPSYEMLTDASSYDYLPFVQAENVEVLQDFYDKYTVTDITAYYVRHPGKMFAMLDVAVKAAFSIRRSYCGNYEISVGLPKQAKSLFWSGWSTFKENSAPKTIGYVIILIAGIVLLYGKSYSLRPKEDRRSTVVLDTLIMVVFVCFSQAIIAIINSGDAELIQHCFLLGFGIDIVSYFVLAEVLHKLNIL